MASPWAVHSPVLDRKKPGGVEVDVVDCTEDINIAVMEGIEPANDTVAIMVKGDPVLLHVLFLCQEAIMLLADNAVLVVQKIICLLGIGQLLQNVDICPSCWTALVDRRRFLVQYLIAFRSYQSSFCLLERVMLDVVNDDIVLGTHVSYHLLRHIFNCGVGSGHWFTAGDLWNDLNSKFLNRNVIATYPTNRPLVLDLVCSSNPAKDSLTRHINSAFCLKSHMLKPCSHVIDSKNPTIYSQNMDFSPQPLQSKVGTENS